MEYRNELKYLCSSSQLEILRIRLLSSMKLDQHLDDNQIYNIRSLYFDDYDNSYFWENEAGSNDRLKVRIRIYNKSSSFIRLELKYKLNSMTKKESCPISEELCHKLMNGKMIQFDECNNNKVLNLLYIQMHTRLLKPKVIVEYDRTVFINKVGNVRVTFDQNIRCSKNIDRFFEDNLYSLPILEKNQHVLEVKYDELLPDYLANCIELGNLKQTAFSKYYLSRIRIGDI